ncbi:DUF4232 domain-containing protein [Streptomyces sp. NPDC088337]|uniref:DUF4232 domain-containing protein n=1 Tax=unclassified Streptomyces TaxID=2593676 RepID=UPI002DD8DDF4|nr:DUF4232 domain-containing protein [Streptomyces sp. NBC_01788]WSB24697.1 DUF4232 domain-containing protein [Streptomyces sp. NBC_01788]
MSAIRTSRTRLARAAAIVVLSALSLTACNDGAGVNDEGSVGSSTAASPSESVPASEAPADGSPASSSSSSAAQPVPAGSKPAANAPATNAPATKPPVSSGKPVTCEGSNTKTVAAPLNRPVNHMLLTVTNTGSKPCYLYTYPALRFGEAQAVPPVLKDSQPQAVVTLGPGESGYASVNLSAADGSGSHGRTEKSLTVYFHGPSGNESVGAGAHPSLPATGVYIDDSLNVTYWQQSMDDALTW